MKVNVPGKGVISFPDSMTAEDIHSVLLSKFPPREDYGVKALEAIKTLLERKVPDAKEVKVPVVTERIVQIDKPVYIERSLPVQVVEKQVIVKESVKPTGWVFEVERDEDDNIMTIRATPND